MGVGRTMADRLLARSIVAVAAILLGAGTAPAQSAKVLLTGTVVDPSGLGVPGVELTLGDTITGTSRSAVSDASGRYRLPDLPAGRYRLDVNHPGFAPYSRDVRLDEVPAESLDIRLQLQPLKESVTVRTSHVAWSDSEFGREFPAPPNPFAVDTAQLLESQPGVALYGNGGVSRLPAIHGMADDRVRIKVDGMDLISACANHMNPPLSYIDPSRVGSINVFAGITPVSVGGDSIGGTILVESPRPEFVAPAQHLSLNARAQTSYRGKGNGYGSVLQFTMAGESLSMTYNGSFSAADNYKASQDFKPAGDAAVGRGWLGGDEVGSSRYEAQNHVLGFALRRGRPPGRSEPRPPVHPVPGIPQPAHGHDQKRQRARQPPLHRAVRVGCARRSRVRRLHAALDGLRQRQAVRLRQRGDHPGAGHAHGDEGREPGRLGQGGDPADDALRV